MIRRNWSPISDSPAHQVQLDYPVKLSLGRVTNVSFAGESGKQAGLPVSFGGLGCRRAGNIALLL